MRNDPVKKIGLMASVLMVCIRANASDMDGVWQLQYAGSTQAKLDEAVETVVQEMNFFIRALARPVLKKQTQICHQWKLQSQANQFQWQCDSDKLMVIPMTAKGDLLEKDEEGIEIMGTFQTTDDSVVTVLESERGKRTNTWRLLGENELLYTVKLESEKLPKPMTWSLSYKR